MSTVMEHLTGRYLGQAAELWVGIPSDNPIFTQCFDQRERVTAVDGVRLRVDAVVYHNDP
jgi:hypothetical protein